MMGLDNPLHIAFLLVILLLVFGAKRLPELGRSLGEGMRGFKTSIEGSAVSAGIAAPASAQAAGAAQPVSASAPSPVLADHPDAAPAGHVAAAELTHA
jgi:sec-independent protein translocase protein TatA